MSDISRASTHRLIGSGVNGVTGDYSRGASGFWSRRQDHPSGERGDDRGPSVRDLQSIGARHDLEFRYGVNAPTVRIEGLTLRGGR